MEKDFIIDQVSWHTDKIRNYNFDSNIIYEYFHIILKYLQENQLTVRYILPENHELTKATCIRASDLTEDGLKLMQKAYSKWVDKVVDQKIQPEDVRVLDKALKVIRSENL